MCVNCWNWNFFSFKLNHLSFSWCTVWWCSQLNNWRAVSYSKWFALKWVSRETLRVKRIKSRSLLSIPVSQITVSASLSSSHSFFCFYSWKSDASRNQFNSTSVLGARVLSSDPERVFSLALSIPLSLHLSFSLSLFIFLSFSLSQSTHQSHSSSC